MSESNLGSEGRDLSQPLRKIAARLDEFNISYAVVGGMALIHHGYGVPTADIELLVTRDGLTQIQEKLGGPDYTRSSPRSRELHDAESQADIKFLVAGAYPGDGDPKPVQFPDPELASVRSGGVNYLTLAALIELKLAATLTGAARPQELADVQELIRRRKLSKEYASWLNPSVRGKYLELWTSAR